MPNKPSSTVSPPVSKWDNPAQFLHDLRAAPRPFYVLDVETTGVRGSDEVVEIAIVASDGSIVINELVKPVSIHPLRWSNRAVKVHGIYPSHVADSQWLIQHMGSICASLGDMPVIFAFNAQFDKRLMTQSFTASGRGDACFSRWRWYCAMALFSNLYGLGRVSLSEAVSLVAHRSGRAYSGSPAHRALADVQATLYLLENM